MFLIVFHQFSGPYEGIPEAVTGFWVVLLDGVEELAHVVAMTVFFIWAQLHLLLIAAQLGIASDVGLFDHAERTDDAQGHLLHFEQGGHRVEAALVELVHQAGVEQVVLMMAKGYLVAA